MQKISTCLWFDNQAEEAVKFYTSVFKNSKIGSTTHYDEASSKEAGMPAGTVLTMSFELEGRQFMALNGGPIFKFNESVSLIVNCDDQKEVDYYWDKLSEGGDEKAQQCGWLKDKYGVSWQIVPEVLSKLVGDPASEKSQRAMKAMLQMKKIDIEGLKKAYEGQ